MALCLIYIWEGTPVGPDIGHSLDTDWHICCAAFCLSRVTSQCLPSSCAVCLAVLWAGALMKDIITIPVNGVWRGVCYSVQCADCSRWSPFSSRPVLAPSSPPTHPSPRRAVRCTQHFPSVHTPDNTPHTSTWLQEIIITHADFITLFQISIWSHLTGWM